MIDGDEHYCPVDHKWLPVDGVACERGGDLLIYNDVIHRPVRRVARLSPAETHAHDLLASLRALEARLTACANAFYVIGTTKAIRAAFDGWKNDIEPARAAIKKATDQTPA